MLSGGDATKNGKPTFGFSFTTMIQHTGRFLDKDFLAKKNVTSLEHTPYFPDLASPDFYLFAPMKSA